MTSTVARGRASDIDSTPFARMDEDYIAQVFEQGGLMAQHRPGYAVRPGQLSAARAFDASMRDGGVVLVEAPTGTGKTLAYAVPAAYHAQRKKRTVIVTANLVLQDQIIHDDLPMLQKLLPWPFTFAVLKGRSNYVCLDRIAGERARTHDPQAEPEHWNELEAEDLASLLSWAESTQSGDRSELRLEPQPRVRRLLFVGHDDCKESNCPSNKSCFAERARKRAADADIIVTNYHLLCMHLAFGNILPQFDCLVLDEGHAAPDIARRMFGFEISVGSIRHALRPLRQTILEGEEMVDDMVKCAESFFAALKRKHEQRGVYKPRIREPNFVDDWDDLVGRLRRAADICAEAAVPDADEDAHPDPRMEKAASRLKGIAHCIEGAMQLRDGQVYYVSDERDEDTGQVKRTKLCARPIDVGPLLHAAMAEIPSVCITSATLRSGGSFGFIRREFGVDKEQVTEWLVPSPFDWARQAICVVPQPDRLPLPDDKRFNDAVAWCTRKAIEKAHGRTLALFTSWARLRYVREQIKDCGYRVLCQGEMPRKRLLDEFRRDVSSVLLGTESLWTGVDVPGEALSCLVIDKFPFSPQDDPVLDALVARDGFPTVFHRYMVPRAIMAMRQGLGRLIRRTTDRGVVVLLDARIIRKPYGLRFRQSLPKELRIVHHMSAVGEFLDSAEISAAQT